MLALGILVAPTLTGCGSSDDPHALQLISVGDSLAVGVQPTLFASDEETSQGYPRQFATMLRDRGETVELHELGCGAATSASILQGARPCAPKRNTPYRNEDPSTSQVTYAEGLLSRTGGQRRMVLLDIGGNDVGACLQGGRVAPGCFARAGDALRKNLNQILERLRLVAPKTPIGVLSLYDPLLGLWDKFPAARPVLQREHRTFLRAVNATIADAARRHDATLVDLAAAMDQDVPFSATDRTRPRAVAAVCALTWMCVSPPRVPDIHLRREGYALAARTALHALDPALRGR